MKLPKIQFPSSLWFKINNENEIDKLYIFGNVITPGWLKDCFYNNQVVRIINIKSNKFVIMTCADYNIISENNIVTIDEYINVCKLKNIY